MKFKSVTFALMFILSVLFAIEIATHPMGNELALLKMGALPTNGQLNGEYWRIVTYSLLHLNWQHFILNLAALWWLDRLAERRVGSIQLALIYGASILLSGIAILIWHGVYPGTGSAVGASGGIFGRGIDPCIPLRYGRLRPISQTQNWFVGIPSFWGFLFFQA